MNQNVDPDDTNESLDQTVLNDVPIIITSSPSMTDNGSAELVALGLSSDHNSDNDEFDTSFIKNNNHRQPSFLRSPTANNLNSSNASRGVSFQFPILKFFQIDQ